MARALIAGLRQRAGPQQQISVGEPLAEARSALQSQWAVRACADNREAVQDAELIILAVKPQQAATVLTALQGALRSDAVLLSIAAGLRIADLAALCPAGMAIVRAMPNRPALLGAGITGLYAPDSLTASQRRLADLVGSAAGRAVWLRSEPELDIVTALSGSGPAYFLLLAEELARAGQTLGLEPATATLLATETLYGSGLLAHSGTELAQERAAVTSRGGTTEAALQALQGGGFGTLIAAALQAATARSAELAEALNHESRRALR